MVRLARACRGKSRRWASPVTGAVMGVSAPAHTATQILNLVFWDMLQAFNDRRGGSVVG